MFQMYFSKEATWCFCLLWVPSGPGFVCIPWVLWFFNALWCFMFYDVLCFMILQCFQNSRHRYLRLITSLAIPGSLWVEVGWRGRPLWTWAPICDYCIFIFSNHLQPPIMASCVPQLKIAVGKTVSHQQIDFKKNIWENRGSPLGEVWHIQCWFQPSWSGGEMSEYVQTIKANDRLCKTEPSASFIFSMPPQITWGWCN